MKWTLLAAGIYTVILLTMAERQASAGIELLTKSIMRGDDYTFLNEPPCRARRLMLWQTSGGSAVKWTSWGFLAIVGSLLFLALYLKHTEIRDGVDRLSHFQLSPHL